MKRPDVRLAWREKLTICFMIFGFCGIVLFYIIFFGKILCPNMDKVWNTAELGGHNDQANFWVAVSGEVYDITKFWRGDHSSVSSAPVTQTDMLQLAGVRIDTVLPRPSRHWVLRPRVRREPSDDSGELLVEYPECHPYFGCSVDAARRAQVRELVP